jgi:hypothetical protein
MRFMTDPSKLGWAPALCWLLAAIGTAIGGRPTAALGFAAVAAMWAAIHASSPGTRWQRLLFLTAGACAFAAIFGLAFGFGR